VFIPVLQHACFLPRNEDLAKRIAAELAVLPAALALDIDGWKRLMTWAKTSLEPVSVELATTPLAEAQGRKALAEAERKRQAIATLDGAGRRVTPPDPAPPLVGRDDLLAELTRLLAGKARRSVLLVGDEAAGKSALATAWSVAHPARMVWATSASELVAGASALGEWQARIAAVLAAAETLDAVLYFDDFGALFADRPAEGGIELGGALRHHVVDGRVRVIGELTAVALDRAERHDVSLIGAMLRVHVPPTDPKTTIAAVLAASETLDALLYFDDFGALFADRPAEGGVELGAAMRRHVVDGRVRVIGELTAVALDRAERRDVSLIGSMLRVTVPPTDPATTIQACTAWASYWAQTQPQRPQIAPAMIPTAVELARRYLPYRAFPGKAVRLLEELRVAHDAGRDAQGAGPLLGPRELFAAFSWSTGIPIALLSDDQALAQRDVIAALRRRMVGQDAAVRRVAEAISVAKARLQPADKPLASLLFVGPTGTGKTELARSVAAYLFGAPDRMVRLDMSEYTDPWAAERLFGSGGDEGRLTSAVRSQPFGVVLLDEIEKAHPSVFDLLLQVLGEARLTDGRGRTTFFHNAIIVLTSNLGTRSARGKLGISPSEADEDREERRYRDAVLGAFRPELINRLDQIVVFHPLTQLEIAKVAEIAIGRLAERRGFTQSGVILDVSPRALDVLSEGGFSPELGARALRRHLDRAVLGPAGRLLARAGADGHGGTLTVRATDETVVRPLGSRIAETAGEVNVALWRRPATTGRKMVRSALALGGLRRDTDRELALPGALAVRDKVAEIESTLAIAARKTDGKAALPGREIARLSTEHARLRERWSVCIAAQGELRTAEELCLDALAKDIDAVDLIDAAILQRQKFRRDLFWLLTALRPVRPGATLLVHSPDARMAVVTWVKLALDAAAHHGWRGTVQLWGEQAPNASSSRPQAAGWHPWGPPRDREWAAEHLASRAPAAALVRIHGAGADLLFGLERGLHRFHGVAGEPSHVWVDLLEPRGEIADPEWLAMPGPPSPRAARGTPMREAVVGGDRTLVDGEDIDIRWSELALRLAEAAVVRLIGALLTSDGVDALWSWERPLQEIEARLEKAKDDRP
jgi:ATP-dependent Clp protease ATP-binding subunit ClpC